MPTVPKIASALGSFTPGVLTNHAGTRPYKLYVPTRRLAHPAPLLVMLHGCTQNPDDFALGTRMNELAEEYGCHVVYPQQVPEANPGLCWNWFAPTNQHRDGGEPSIVADITRAVTKDHGIDGKRVFIAGMSAGGAMAVVMGATYPELYAAIGVHSGIAYGAATSMFAAPTVMRSGGEDSAISPLNPVRAIVFHGDRDQTVHPRNGEQVLQQLLGASNSRLPGKKPRRVHGKSNGRAYDQTIYRDAAGKTVAEEWTVHGTAHAWSGGNAAGSHTDSSGPDASREMLRFFLGSPAFSRRRSRFMLPTGLIRRYLRRFKVLPGER
jgi:poly(hydroxyalkanoate) depolymerase family esterase